MSHWILLFAVLLTALYLLLMVAYTIGWWLQKTTCTPTNFQPATKVDIIIPARNEQDNIGNCLASVLAQYYPKHLFNVVVVNDFSEDNTAGVVASFTERNVRLIELADALPDRSKIISFKKAALSAAIAHTHGELIVTTDADCVMGASWLRQIVSVYEEGGCAAVIGPVSYSSDFSMVGLFQILDFMTMQGITAAAHRLGLGKMANGANFAFSRSAFVAVDGYVGTTHLASGDDYLLLAKLAHKFPDGIRYVKSKEAIVSTLPQSTWKALLNQRIRWASKTGKYKDSPLTAVLVLVYLFNLSLLGLFVLGFIEPVIFPAFLFLIGVKIIGELVFLIPVSRFFTKSRELLVFLFFQPVHILYICLAGFLGIIGKYEWKGRKL